ncbi:V-type proton ATPase subunit E-like [Haemaphysalis longicornis]
MAAKVGHTEMDVSKPIKHMLAFIEQEANEKVQEIDAKAEEEFNTEKGRLVQEQRIKIINAYSKKEKQVERQRKIQSSHMKNAARLRILLTMNEHVKKVLAEARKCLGAITKQEGYKPLLKNLILQGMLLVLAKDVVVRCRRADVNHVESVLPAALKMFKDKTKIQATLSVDKVNFLPDSCFGGVVLATNRGRILISNTLESRLELISSRILPQIRTGLFGKNANRKYRD